jgi:hypothetical protein
MSLTPKVDWCSFSAARISNLMVLTIVASLALTAGSLCS